MQKKILALAVAGLVSGGAFAQSNVTVYGVMDAFYAHAWDSYTANAKSSDLIGSGGQSGSRIGFKGSEELGNGLKANFQIEGGINIDTGTNGQSGVFGRWTTVGLSGAWGEVQAGRRNTFEDQLLGDQDANARTTVAQVSPVYSNGQSRIGNFIAYLSPDWKGLQIRLGYSSAGQDAAVQEVPLTTINSTGDSAASNTNFQVFTAAAKYANGPLLLIGTYTHNTYEDRDSNVADVSGNYGSGNLWNVGGAYDFGVVRINGVIGEIEYAQNFGEVRDTRKQWSLGASAPIGQAGKLALTYANAKIDYIDGNSKDDEMQMWGIAYFHTLSKRTNLYAAYGRIDQDDTFSYAKYKATIDSMTTGSQQAIQVGLRHQF